MHFMAIRKRKTKIKVQCGTVQKKCSSADRVQPSINLLLQRRARRHATINVVDFNDVTRCQNMVDVSDVTTCQNKHARFFCVCDVTDGRTDGHFSVRAVLRCRY